MRVACLFALYPLGRETHMEAIYGSIERARADGRVTVTPLHFATRLDGDFRDVLDVIRGAFDEAGANHVVVHATISTGSPTEGDS
jgi:isopropylmalate/homocitrate/citramalate synthase